MVEIYGIRRRIGSFYYEDVVSAASWEDAEVIAERVGGEVTGKIISEIDAASDDLDYGFRTGTDW